ncbi:hypothetical protein P152DRAFT_447506 [Eremomyces bilateralis CBS 781.70]|uniref:Uncharacterized protein n=1 Tax=Eremomyces bilateralis CBS 781.70 TaxID=1392243 RepID=A0A6G1GB78_9PEZI|nr:uncharacterized protein P152DRAFT_447506 [Eremomyces bilateralis CBS 781.70]KAF1815274.1 hypothetical protein P152DRAFT_447506 [Eremomyces bilateralis CBS 781.70]
MNNQQHQGPDDESIWSPRRAHAWYENNRAPRPVNLQSHRPGPGSWNSYQPHNIGQRNAIWRGSSLVNANFNRNLNSDQGALNDLWVGRGRLCNGYGPHDRTPVSGPHGQPTPTPMEYISQARRRPLEDHVFMDAWATSETIDQAVGQGPRRLHAVTRRRYGSSTTSPTNVVWIHDSHTEIPEPARSTYYLECTFGSDCRILEDHARAESSRPPSIDGLVPDEMDEEQYDRLELRGGGGSVLEEHEWQCCKKSCRGRKNTSSHTSGRLCRFCGSKKCENCIEKPEICFFCSQKGEEMSNALIVFRKKFSRQYCMECGTKALQCVQCDQTKGVMAVSGDAKLNEGEDRYSMICPDCVKKQKALAQFKMCRI